MRTIVIIRLTLVTTLAALAYLQFTIASAQQAYPTRPITMVVAYGAGGTTDVMARAAADSMSTLLGQPVLIDNRSGAGGVIGTSYVASAKPDGYMIGFGTSSQLVMNPALSKLPFNVEKDLQMVGLVVKFPLVLYASNSMPSSLRKLLDMARSQPGRLNYGSGGNGQIGHVAAAMLMKQAGVEAVHIPYRGAAQVLQEIMAGRIDLFMDTLASGGALVKEGKLRVIAVGGTSRSPMLPNVPTFAEQGLPNFEGYSWTSIFAPAGLRPEVLAKLNVAVNAAVQSEPFRQKMTQQGAEPLAPTTPALAASYADRERAIWIPFIKSSGIKSD